MSRNRTSIVLLTSGLLLLSAAGSVRGASDVYAPPKSDEVRSRVNDWLAQQKASDEIRQQVVTLWSQTDASVAADRILELVVQSFALADEKVQRLVQECNSAEVGLHPPQAEMLGQSTGDPFFHANLGLYYGRCLVERRMFDEAWAVLKSIDPRQVVDPASLFFFQAVAAQGMMEVKPALEAVERLLTSTEKVPVRYSATAVLMEADLKAFQEKSLGETARLMSDSERRLELGRAGEKVQGIQDRIISNLDELIKKIEQQQGGGGGGGNSQDGGNNSNNADSPADDSRVKGTEAPGETDKKRFESKGSWGNLPEKDLAKAKNDLNKNFPSNYEQAIEKYTKKLATRAAKKTK